MTMKKLLGAIGILLVASCAAAQAQSSLLIVASINADGTYNLCAVGTAGCNLPVNASVVAGPVTVQALTSTNLSGTVSVTNTFQSIQASTALRQGCTIENQSTTDIMWVFFGAIGGATKAKAFPIGGGSFPPAISCAVGGLGVLTDQVSITGTSADTFAANFQ
jgi:hypothetical protein